MGRFWLKVEARVMSGSDPKLAFTDRENRRRMRQMQGPVLHDVK